MCYMQWPNCSTIASLATSESAGAVKLLDCVFQPPVVQVALADLC